VTLSERLRGRREEIERAVLARVHAVSNPTDANDPEYILGLRTAVSAAIDYWLAVLDNGPEADSKVPPALLSQARYAVRVGVNLDTVLRRYFAGYTLLGDFVLQEADAVGGLDRDEVQQLSRAQAILFDRLVVAVVAEYRSETDQRVRSVEHARAEWVSRLLAGDLVDASDLGYELSGRWHLGAIGSGPGARAAIRKLAAELDRQLLLVDGGEGSAWAWLGGTSRLLAADALCVASAAWPAEVSLAFGEAGEGVAGWRLTHRQAKAALPVALRGLPGPVRYADVALLASALSDEVLAGSLRETYLAPLQGERDGGAALRQTLRAYFAAGRNVSSAAAALGLSRQTVKKRLSLTEERVGVSLDDCTAEIETALRLQDLDAATATK
jgi:hypothetical protein